MTADHESCAGLRPKAILETVLYVDDLRAAEDFYTSVLQLKPIHGDRRMRVLGVSAKNFLLLFGSDEMTEAMEVPGGSIPPHGGHGDLHLAFSIGRDEIDAWSDRLAAEDVVVESTVNWPSGETSLYFRDPSGNLIELATENLWQM